MVSVVTRREGVKGGRPILQGTKLSVLQVAMLVRDHRVSPEEIVEMYSGVNDVEVVREVIKYYDDHLEEMEDYKRAREDSVERLKQRAINY
jgi:uncharacterized protein (DUF433 family)